MADAIVDFASLDSAAVATPDSEAVETPAVETPAVETPVETPAVETTAVEEGRETETKNTDGTEKTPEQQAEFKKNAAAKAEADLPGDKNTPADIRKALKALKDANPQNAAAVKELHGSFERWNAAKAIFPRGVAEMQEVKAFVDSVGGPEGYQKMQEAMDEVSAADELLHNSDPKIWDNVIEDLKANGHPEALAQLAPSFLSKLKEHDKDGYYNTILPHFFAGLQEVGMEDFVNQFNGALTEKNEKGETVPNVGKVASLVGKFTKWYNDTKKTAEEKTAPPVDTPERKKFLAEKTAFEEQRAAVAKEERTKVENSIAEECDKHNNKSLGKELGSYIHLPFFKDFPRETLIDLGNGIKDRLYSTLKNDKAYQTQMSAMWKQKTPDRAKMLQYHQAKVDSIAADIVRQTVQNRYPGYAKGGSAAGKAAAAVVKKEVATKAAATSVTTNKPIYVASRPTDLIHEPIKVNGRDYSIGDLQTMQIAGRGFVKTTDGKSYKLVTWRR